MSLVEVYKALADETRLRILNVLSRGAFNVQELTKILTATQSNISHHLKTLQSAGLVQGRKEGTWAYYQLLSGDDSPALSISKNFVQVSQFRENGLPKTFAADLKGAQSILDQRRDEARAYFDAVAPTWREIREATLPVREYREQLRNLIPSDLSLLELGCGSGVLLHELMPRRGNTIGVDHSEAMLKEAERLLSSDSVDLRLGNLEHLPVSDNSVDIALVHMVLHHVPEPREALKDAFRVVKSGGKLIVIDLVTHENEAMRERFADLWLGFNTDQFKSWVEQVGFKNCTLASLGRNNQAFLLTAIKDD